MDAADLDELNSRLTAEVVAQRLLHAASTDDNISLAEILLNVLRKELTVQTIKNSTTNDSNDRVIRDAYIITVTRNRPDIDPRYKGSNISVYPAFKH